MEIFQNENVVLISSIALFVMSELISASKLKANSVTGLVTSILKMIVGKK